MALLNPARRRLILVILALLIAPILAMPFTPFEAVSRQENRRLAPVPALPSTAEAWRTLPRGIDAYLADHFGFRKALLRSARSLGDALGEEHAAAVEGKGGQMFLLDGLLRSTGREVDADRAADFADFACQAAARLKTSGVKLLVAMPPSPGEIIPELAPGWAGLARRPTEYDLILADLGRCGVASLDLRPVLLAAKPTGRLYRRTDSHWTLRGSLLSYNQIVEALGHPDWIVAPTGLAWESRVLDNGDLPRLAGQGARPEAVEVHDRTGLPPGAASTPLTGIAWEAMEPRVVTSGRPGPTVLMLGDSFTYDPMPPYFAPFVGRFVWVYAQRCGFDWSVMARVKPDYVVLAPTEREAACDGRRPKSF